MFDLSCGIRLRAFRSPPADDLDSILSLYNNTQLPPLMTMLLMVPRGDKLKKNFHESIENDAELFCIVETVPNASATVVTTASEETPQFVGFTALWGFLERGHRHTNFSIVLLPQFCNRGYGQHITRFVVNHTFVHMNIHRISLEVYEGNDRALAVYKKHGFVDEGRQRKAVWINGGWKDIILMGILYEDWKESQPQNP